MPPTPPPPRRKSPPSRPSLAPIEPHPYHPRPFTANTAEFSMLQQMRAFSKSIFASIFMGALALSFVVWGIADVFRSRADTYVAMVGSEEISYDTFSHEYQRFLKTQGRELGHDITPEEAQKSGLGKIALDRLINRTAI